MRITHALLSALVLAASCTTLPAQEAVKGPDVTATVDWTRTDGKVNRALFSTQGFMQIYSQPNPMVMQTFTLLNPKGTQTRLETYLHQMEPENDNDDPAVFNWEKLFPNQMIRFVEERKDFERVTTALGMEPLSLLCYNVGWLEEKDSEQPVKNLDEWAEFAAAVVQSYNGTGDNYRPNLRLAQIWNEPNWDFWTGSDEAWMDLYNNAASRIRRDYPGVMVGGPTVTNAPGMDKRDAYIRKFLETCGENTDYVIFHHYGPMGEGVKPLTDAVRRYADWFRALPGKSDGRIMITETDAWFDGWAKQQFMLERQFRFIDISDLLLGVHHFCCLAYRESGGYTFGFVDKQGGVIEGTFWPYWLFRNWIGDVAYTMTEGPRVGALDLAASHDGDGKNSIATAVFHNRGSEAMTVRTLLYFEPVKEDRVLTFSQSIPTHQGIAKVELVPAGESQREVALPLAPGEGMALTLQSTGRRHFAFRDLNNQETPWIGITAGAPEVKFGATVTVTVRVMNTLLEPVSGTIELAGLPSGWNVRAKDENATVKELKPGAAQEATFTLTAKSLAPGGYVAPYAILAQPGQDAADLDSVAHSIGAAIHVLNPLDMQALPLPVKAVRGEENQVDLQLYNKTDQTLTGTFLVELPPTLRMLTPPKDFSLEPGEQSRVSFPFEVANDAPAGSSKGTISITFLGTTEQVPFDVEISGATSRKATPLDLTQQLNFDAVAFNRNRTDYDSAQMGLFVYPGDFTPSGRVVKVKGMPFRIPSLEDNRKNAIEPRGQKLNVPAGSYSGVAFMGFGHSGKHPGTWTFHYADGSSEKIESQIPEWCTPAPEGFDVAFTAPHRYIPGGPAHPACEWFTWELKTQEGKHLTAITLPEMKNAYLFAVTVVEK